MVLVVDQQALSERRARMLHDWHVNNGTDCGREVDTEFARVPTRNKVILADKGTHLKRRALRPARDPYSSNSPACWSELNSNFRAVCRS